MLILLGCLLMTSVSAEAKPNIVFILVDNLGYGDIGAYGGGEIRGAPTPNIDTIAHQGIKLTNFNVEPECTPSRSALMTGRLPIRSGTSQVPFPGLPQGMVPWENTIAELLGDAGYHSAHYGKWHLGDVQGRYPTDQGFDEWFGFPHSSAEAVWDSSAGYKKEELKNQGLWEGKKGEKSKRIGNYDSSNRALIDEEITNRSVNYIKQHAKEEKPFFLYVPFTLPHSPPLPNPKRIKPGKTMYQNALMEIDYNTGQIINALDEAGIKDNTILVWASDNGPETMMTALNSYGAQSDSGPFRGEFPSAWEGALRVPAMIRWPGHIKPGSSSNEIVSMLDFYATFAQIADAEKFIPDDRPIDSINQFDLITGKTEKSTRQHIMSFYIDDLWAIKFRNFKIHLKVAVQPSGPVQMSGQTALYAHPLTMIKPWVFDIENDPKELWPVSVENAWLGQYVAKIRGKYMRSVRKFPNIKPGSSGPSTE